MLAIALEVSVMTDLTDFGGGYEIDEANPEDKVNQNAYGRGNLSTSWDYIPFFARGDAR
jgi:hypothetical protein